MTAEYRQDYDGRLCAPCGRSTLHRAPSGSAHYVCIDPDHAARLERYHSAEGRYERLVDALWSSALEEFRREFASQIVPIVATGEEGSLVSPLPGSIRVHLVIASRPPAEPPSLADVFVEDPPEAL